MGGKGKGRKGAKNNASEEKKPSQESMIIDTKQEKPAGERPQS